MVKSPVAWHPEFLRRLLSILGEPEQVHVLEFRHDVTTEPQAGMAFYPQYSKIIHYKDLAKPIDREGLVAMYSDQLSEERPHKAIARMTWSNFYNSQPLVSATFEPTRLSVELQYIGPEARDLLDRLHKEVSSWKPRPPSDVRVVFS